MVRPCVRRPWSRWRGSWPSICGAGARGDARSPIWDWWPTDPLPPPHTTLFQATFKESVVRSFAAGRVLFVGGAGELWFTRSLDGTDALAAAVMQIRHRGRWVDLNCPDRSWCVAQKPTTHNAAAPVGNPHLTALE